MSLGSRWFCGENRAKTPRIYTEISSRLRTWGVGLGALLKIIMSNLLIWMRLFISIFKHPYVQFDPRSISVIVQVWVWVYFQFSMYILAVRFRLIFVWIHLEKKTKIVLSNIFLFVDSYSLPIIIFPFFSSFLSILFLLILTTVLGSLGTNHRSRGTLE